MICNIKSEKQEPNSRTEFQKRIHVIQILKFSSPIPRTSRNLIQIPNESMYYTRSVSNARCSRKVPVFSNQCPMGCTTKLFMVDRIHVFASFLVPGKFQENVLQTYSYITYLPLYYMPCVLFTLSIVSIHHPRVDWRTSGSLLPVNDSRLT